MRLFVTGATGALGIPAVTKLVAAGHQVDAVARSSEKAERLGTLGASPVEVDLFDAAAVKDVVAGHEAIVNLATKIPPTAKAARAKAWAENERIRREVSRNLADAALAHGVARMIQESIVFALDDGGDRWLAEDEPLRPPPSLDAVLDAETNAHRVTEAGGVGVVLRFGNFYGPGAGHSVDTIRMVRRRLNPHLGAPDDYWSVIHLDDAAGAVVATLDAPAGSYHVVDDEPLTKAELGDVIAEALGVKPPHPLPRPVAGLAARKAPILARSIRASNARFKDATGWAPRYPSARDGWPATIEAMRLAGVID